MKLQNAFSVHGSPSDTSRPTRSTVEWNGIIRRSPPGKSLSVYAHAMLPSGALPNKFTFTFLLKACIHGFSSSLSCLHAHLILLGLHRDPFLRSSLISTYAHHRQVSIVDHLFRQETSNDTVVYTALVSAYARCGRLESARKVFDEMPQRNPVSWAALLSAYSGSTRDVEALGVFRRMLIESVECTEAALVSALSSAARLGALMYGQRAHLLIVLSGMPVPSAALGTALLGMYAKCGLVDDALKVFDRMPQRDQPAWTSMISALAAHGRGPEALDLFGEMLEFGFKPDSVICIAVLHACSHAGLVEKAREYFNLMVRVYGIKPGLEHYGCMVDVLGRAGQVEEAWKMVHSMPMEADEYVLKSLLCACCNHIFLEYAEWAAEKLMSLNAGQASSYVLLSNAYASLGQWDSVERLRKLMRARGVPKISGSSAVE
ncbi:pentatricopeptide repeat-containing protein At5g06540-like [Dioscorea cayenensis subsp. rotundata]|uniref:Pentatricopeptide repeat-containing protein At5g06540-like n=1 Tax=Dioscorea cayennensis subsp. rotundata TaxID=55577 RepID=A0AB40AM84_DIOCR|nr:pentatricopeptide repeat-containing protein At5g06540-like [Dioscorea cayenensis subsp. rotundata]XP_039116144.1 pentatricopeptide repeat-containing protein At5g06540-like [Dioscorea cayenensis subsp. rotundata]XP_039116145.1 pentatricopeptide repeat-containing protein At5g06540-like [Dioscorea cayenensis subsp. rotundata]